MHELSITQQILDIALSHAKKAEAKKVTGIFLVIGEMASVVDNSVQFYWDMISEDTIAQGAKLHFRRIPTQFQCKECEHIYGPDGREMACPSCEGILFNIITGNEFNLEAIDVE